MATTIVTKSGSGAPTASDLVAGELAVDLTNKRLYTEDSGGTVLEVGSNPYNFTANHDGSAKLATTASGIDVTGSVTADRAAVYSGVLSEQSQIRFGYSSDYHWSMGRENASTGDLVIESSTTGTDTERLRILASGNIKQNSVNTSTNVGYAVNNGTYDAIALGTGGFGVNGGAATDGGIRAYNNLLFGTGASSTERMRIDSSGNVGIGTSSPDSPLEIQAATNSSSDTTYLKLYNAGENVGNIDFENGNGSLARITGTKEGAGASANDGILTFSTALDATLSEKMRISSNGNVGIGVVPNTGWNSTYKVIQVGNAGAVWSEDASSSNTLISNNEVYNTNGSYYRLVAGAANDILLQNDGSFQFRSTATSAAANSIISDQTTKMMLDASGNLLVGKTATAFGTAGVEASASNGLWSTRSELPALALNRLSTDGSIADFYKDGTNVGTIGSIAGGYLSISGTTGGRLQINGTDEYAWDTTQFYPANDNANDLGFITKRWDDIYATNGTIQTSDRNEKQDIAELSDAEQRVAVAAKGLLRKFRWKDSVEEKGDEARTHFGIIAQDLQAAFAAEGLDAGDYAMFINSTWTDEETGEERSRMGVRYSELLAFIIAAI